MWAQIFFRFVIINAFDRETEGQKFLRNTVCCITCSRAVKTEDLPISRLTVNPFSTRRLHVACMYIW